jgi:voltage-gated potassium channel
MHTWFSRWRFVWLLAAMFGLLVLVPADRSGIAERVLAAVLLTAVYAAAFLVVLADARYRLGGLLIGFPALIGAWANLLAPGAAPPSVVVAGHVLSVIFLTFLISVILRMVFLRRAVSGDDIAASLCAYLLIGAAFGHVYALVEALAPGSFRGDAFAAADASGNAYLLLTYFSYVTLTTVGFGDITPGTGLTRGLAATEAVVGQFYLAVLVASLIGKKVAQALSEGTKQPPGD